MRTWCAGLAAAAVLAARAAWADCAMPNDYLVTDDPAGTVRIRPRNNAGRTCPDAGLLRRNVDQPDAIVLVSTCDGDEFVDECVPAGTYQYGFAQPYRCDASACGTFFFSEKTIAGAAPTCTRDIPAPAAAPSVPWSSDQPRICGYGGRSESGGCGVAPASVLGTNLGLFLLGLAGWRWRPGRRTRP